MSSILLQARTGNITPLLALLLLLNNLNDQCTLLISAAAKSNVFIVYMGKKPHDNQELLVESHHEILTSILGSREASAESMVYSYRHGFSGFAAKLTEIQAQRISELPTVVKVIPNRFYKIQTTRSWDYLQLSPHHPPNLLNQSKMGEGVIIGLLDTGLWPESQVFNDEGLGPVPSTWRGKCESGEQFNPAKACNRKLIGARFFIRGLEASLGRPFNTTQNLDYLSPRDALGHGTHTSTTAAGSFAPNKSYNGLGIGTVRGGAPRARLAMYKVCWNLYDGVCSEADLLKALDEAINDGVNVLSLSIGADIPLFSDVDVHNGVALGSFHAVERGIVVVCAAGNGGPLAHSVVNTAPWVLTVAASTLDRSFPTPITLGNNWTTMGQAMYTGKDTAFTNLVYPEVSDLDATRGCSSLTSNDTWVDGKVVLCFASDSYDDAIYDTAGAVQKAGGRGLIIAKNPAKFLFPCPDDFPCILVSPEIGMQILFYIRSTSSPQVRIRPSKTHVGRPVSTTIAYFSSRGPSSISPAILKPDIAAPGVNILAAVPPSDPELKTDNFAFQSGTSMATPHVSGIVALLRSLHRHWSPAAIKSAIVTTAWTTDPSGETIFAEGEPMKQANPFDFGGGIVNSNRAADPGLVYDMSTADYIHYLCAMGYNISAISRLTKASTVCPPRRLSILDINVPSITIPSLKSSTKLTRSVTNVGAVNSIYRAVVEAPIGITVAVTPRILCFNRKVRVISFSVTVCSTHQVTAGYSFGSLTWKDGVHSVRIPISVRTEIAEPYDRY